MQKSVCRYLVPVFRKFWQKLNQIKKTDLSDYYSMTSFGSPPFPDMIDNVEKKAQTPFENIRTPRPWEIDTDEHKRKYMKSAYIEVEKKIDRREAEKDKEESRIQAEIDAIRRKNAQKNDNINDNIAAAQSE